MEDKTQNHEEKQIFICNIARFQGKLPDELVSQVVNKVKYLIPVMLDAARPEEKTHTNGVFFNEIKVSSFGISARC